MTAKELYEFAKSHNFENTQLCYPEYGSLSILADVSSAQATISTEFQDERLVVFNSSARKD